MPKNNIIILDKLDRKILYELDVDARQSLTQLGKRLRISKDVVKYRIDRMIKNGVITGFYAEVDAYKTGYFAARMLLRFYNITLEKEKEIVSFLVNDPLVAWVHAGEGNWDLLFGFWVKNIFEFYRYQEMFFDKFGTYIQNKKVSIYHRMYQFKKDYLVGKKRSVSELNYMGGEHHVSLDRLDRNILAILINNARTPLYEMANRLGVSSKVIAYRIKRMRNERLILSFRPMFDLGRIGYSWFKLHVHLKNIDEKKRKALFNYVASLPNVVYIDEMIGGYDFECDMDLRSHAELRSFVEKVRTRFPDIIRDFETMDFYRAYKTLVWFPKESGFA